MRTPPRSPEAPLLDRNVLGRAFGFLGVVQAAVSLALVPLGAWLWLDWQPGMPLPREGAAHALLSTLVFASIVLMQIANAFECRSTPGSLFAIGPLSNRLLLGAVAVELLVLGAFIYEPTLQRLLGHAPLEPEHWLLLAGPPIALLVAEELRKLIVRHASRASPAGAKDGAP